MNVVMGAGSLLLIGVFLSLCLLLMGFVHGPLGAWLPGLFPAPVRYTGASVAFNIGGIFGGGMTPLIAEGLAERGGLALVGLYLSGAAGAQPDGAAAVEAESRIARGHVPPSVRVPCRWLTGARAEVEWTPELRQGK